MNELFGVSMNLIMYVLLALLGVSLASIVLVALRNRIMFNLGVRNIPRRKAQTTLIVVGLMLSPVIISAAFATGDTAPGPEVGAVLPAYADFAVAVNYKERLSSPLFYVLGLDPEAARDLPDIEDVRGGRLRLPGPAPGGEYVHPPA